MKRSEALLVLRDVASRVDAFGVVRWVGSSLTLDAVPVASVNASNAIVVPSAGSAPAATFTRAGSEAQIASLILARFAARRAA
jgi:hypothetical protein